MSTKSRLLSLIVSAFLVGAASLETAQAASSYLTPLSQTVTPGDAVLLELWMDFTGDPTIGGGVDVKFHNFVNGTQLTFVSYTPAALGDPLLINVPSVSAAGDALEGVTFGDLDNGLEGPALVGTLAFIANNIGNYSFSLADNADAGGFFSTTGPQQFPLYAGASVTVEAVPLPASAWLMLSGLTGLVWRRRSL